MAGLQSPHLWVSGDGGTGPAGECGRAEAGTTGWESAGVCRTPGKDCSPGSGGNIKVVATGQWLGQHRGWAYGKPG